VAADRHCQGAPWLLGESAARPTRAHPTAVSRFNQLGQETGIEEGTGIGLVVSEHLIEFMGGTIGVPSTVGVGSVFWIELPAESAVERGLDKK